MGEYDKKGTEEPGNIKLQKEKLLKAAAEGDLRILQGKNSFQYYWKRSDKNRKE